ncbi:MAG TPA: hypothetical protein GX507_10315 [Clostridia bacterium]|nr:hypothetical protein [Clostridia bacterium]
MSNKVLVIGVGEVGGHALEFLCRTPGITHVYAMDVNRDKAARKLACATYGAMFEGYFPKVEFIPGNVFDVAATAETIRRIQPDVILNTASLQSWWVITLLPEPLYKRLQEAAIGPWLPMHLAPTYKVMQAVKESGIDTKVVSTPFPDVVNPVLNAVGLAPTVGAGNLDELIPPFQKYVADRMGVPSHSVEIFMVGHHFHNDAMFEMRTLGGAPYFLKIIVDGRDVTDQFPAEETLLAATEIYPIGKDDSPVIASSAIKNVLAILNDSGLRTHAPGPKGLPGGYPVRIDSRGVEVVLPEGITLEEAVSINKEAQKFDGVEEIRDDGTVVFTDKAYKVMKDVLGYDCRVLALEDAEEAAKELRRAYDLFVSKATKSA